MFKSMTVGKKITLGFSMVIVFLAVVGGTGYLSMSSTMDQMDAITGQVEIAKYVNSAMADAQDAQANSLRSIVYGDEKYYVSFNEGVEKAVQEAQEAKGKMKSEENKKRADNAIAGANEYLAANKEYYELGQKKEAAGKVRAENARVVLDNIKTLMERRQALIDERAEDTDKGKVIAYAEVVQTLRAQEARNAFNRANVCAQKYQLALNPDAQDEAANLWVAEIETTRKTLEECKANMNDPACQKALDNSLQTLTSYLAQVDVFRQLNRQQRQVRIEKQRPAALALMTGCREMRDGVEAFVENTNKEADAQVTLASTLIIGIGISSIIAGILAAFFITRGITKPLNRIIAGLNEGADQVNDAAGQVSSASQQLAEGAGEQASSLEETSSALEEMSAMTRANAQNAKQANELASAAKTNADQGDQTMHQLNSAMGAINESSGQISKIIKVIEEIAFQTNLLALNAAVEAARAGEHGKGFAVVAEEVRNLAQRSAQAARDTTNLIEGSVTRAKEGTTVADSAGKALQAIVSDVTKVADLLNGITQASQEQAQGVDQVNTAVSEMDKVTQQNAAGAEESASAAEELSAQAATLKGVVEELGAMVSGAQAKNAAASTHKTAPAKRKPQIKAHAPHIALKVGAAKGEKVSDEFEALNEF